MDQLDLFVWLSAAAVFVAVCLQAVPVVGGENAGSIILNGWDARDKEISTRAYAFNGYRLNYYVSPNYRGQIHYVEI